MKVERTLYSNGEAVYEVEGRIDTITAPEFEKAIKENADSLKKVVIDMTKLEYISSAGLRALLSLHKKVSTNGTLIIRNANDMVSEVFEVTGFSDILYIE